MTRYAATIKHHSISRARIVPVGDTLTSAKRGAVAEFSDEHRDYQIVILDMEPENFDREIVSIKRVGARKWVDQ
jgi:hypothetical protein